jgi:hypothetical protein
MLNYATPRKSVFVNEPFNSVKFEKEKKEKDIQNLMKVNIIEEKSLVKDFKSLNLNEKVNRSLCFDFDKENEPDVQNIVDNTITTGSSVLISTSLNNTNYYSSILNFDRLKRIENKKNVKTLFNFLDN